jgi:hypothetical protein
VNGDPREVDMVFADRSCGATALRGVGGGDGNAGAHTAGDGNAGAHTDGRRGPQAIRPVLRGELHDFRGFDVCQLLSMTGATGILRLRAMGVRGEIYVDEGRVVGVRARPHARRLGRVLREARAVDDGALARAIASQDGRRPHRLGEILLARGAIEAPTLESALDTQAAATLTALLILPAGRFAFTREPLPRGFRRLEVDPQALVLDALARIDELRAGRRSA